MQTNFQTKEQVSILAEISRAWDNHCGQLVVLEGLPGTGKKTLAQKIDAKAQRTSVTISLPSDINDSFETFVMNLDWALECSGLQGLSALLDNLDIKDPATDLARWLFRQNMLLIVDGFENSLNQKGEIRSKDLSRLFNILSKSNNSRLKIVLTSNQRITDNKWMTRTLHFHIKGFDKHEATVYFASLLRKENLIQKVPESRFTELVTRLAFNPRAINTFVRNGLFYESLEALISLAPKLFQPGDVKLERRLVEDLENAIFQLSLNRLSDSHKQVLNFLSVYRQPFSSEVYSQICLKDNSVGINEIRRELQNLYLIESVQLDSLHPLLREICVTRLRDETDGWSEAQNIAADYLMRKFKLSDKPSKDKVATSFTELRHHLIESSRLKDLANISYKFTNFLCARITKPQQSQVPANRAILEERIHLISSLPEQNRTHGLEYHLAVCLRARGLEGDLALALQHSRRAEHKDIYYAYWLLRLDLEYQLGGLSEAERVFRVFKRLSSNHGKSVSIYLKLASLQKSDRQDEKAAATLLEGVGTVQPGALTEIGPECARTFEVIGKTSEAIQVLIKCIETPGVTRKASLYAPCAKLLAQEKKYSDAQSILQRAIADDGVSKKYLLQLSYAEIYCLQNKELEAIDYLKESIGSNRIDDLIQLYILCSRLMVKNNLNDESSALLNQGVSAGKIKNPAALYLSIAETIESDDGYKKATDFLRATLSQNKSCDRTAIYGRCAKIYFTHKDIEESISILELAIADDAVTDKWRFYKDCAEHYNRIGQADKAITLLIRAVGDPNCSNIYVAYIEAANIYVKNNQRTEAITFLKKGIATPALKDKGAIHLKYAALLTQDDKYHKAIESLYGAMNEPGMTRRWELMKSCAEYLNKQQRWNESLELLESGLATLKGGNIAELYNVYTKTLITLNKRAEAHFALREGLSKYPNNKGLVWTLNKLVCCEEISRLGSYKEGIGENKNTYEETQSKLTFFKQMIENQDCYRIFYNGRLEREAAESHVQYTFKLVWENSLSSVDTEVNNGRGAVDFKISRGATDITLVEFKLASNSALEQNIENQTPIYALANSTDKYFTAIVYFSDRERERILRLYNNQSGLSQERLFIIDARPKKSASTVRNND